MRNVWKARVAPLMGVIALVAVAALFTTACGEEPEDIPPPKGRVEIVIGEGGPFTGAQLSSEYKPGENDELNDNSAGRLWYKEDTSANEGDPGVLTIETNKGKGNFTSVSSDLTLKTFTPNQPGNYILIAVDLPKYNEVTNNGNNPDAVASLGYIKSSVFEVKQFGTEESQFFGTWNSASFVPTSGNYGSSTESILINYQKLNLEFTPTSGNVEKCEFTINKWDLITSNLPEGYTVGYKLSVKNTLNQGYVSGTPANTIGIFFSTTTGNTIIRSSFGTNNTAAIQKSGTGAAEIDRVYTK